MELKELRQKNAQQLTEQLGELRREQFNLRMQKGSGQLTADASVWPRSPRDRAGQLPARRAEAGDSKMNDNVNKEHTVEGRVVSNKMVKTVTVLLERQVQHPLYGKIMRRSTKVHAHDEVGECKEGDVVRIAECRPLSKTKNWRVVKIITRAEA